MAKAKKQAAAQILYEEFVDQGFQDQEMVVDGKRFQNCQFDNVTFVFSGARAPIFSGCRFGRVRLQFEGSASRTLTFLTRMNKGGFSAAVEKIIQGIY